MFFVGGRRFRGEKFVGVGRVGWLGDAAEEDVSCRELTELRSQAEKIFLSLRAVFGRCGREKNVRTR